MGIGVGDSLEILKTLEESSFDSLVTDPPAGISFMGKDWDDDRGGRKPWIEWLTEVMKECLRVMKPGAHGLVWAIPRTSHWTATALENAGFEIRDVITHHFGSGFPKSLDISKAIDKSKGATREVVGERDRYLDGKKRMNLGDNDAINVKISNNTDGVCKISAPSTDLAKQWQGFGTALKPASEHWILVRKPCSEKTVARNVEKWGCGGINIDECRIETSENLNGGAYSEGERIRSESAWGGGVGGGVMSGSNSEYKQPYGRFPANLLLSHTEECEEDICSIFCPVRIMDQQSGDLGVSRGGNDKFRGGYHFKDSGKCKACGFGDSGGASRFFKCFRYCAKASKKDRGEENNHPTIKSTKLMEYLITLVTPPKGKVLDPFMGSGSTGVAAKRLGFEFTGIEKNIEYANIAKTRISRT